MPRQRVLAFHRVIRSRQSLTGNASGNVPGAINRGAHIALRDPVPDPAHGRARYGV